MKEIIKIAVALSTVVLFVTSMFIPITTSRMDDTKNTNTLFKDKFMKSTIYIEASSWYEYGLKIGKRFRLQYMLLDLLTTFTKNKVDLKDIENHINAMEKYSPLVLEELKGLSASLNMRLERLLSLHKSIHSILDVGCTTTLSTGKATKNNETFLTMNGDTGIKGVDNWLGAVLLRMFALKCWIVRINTMKYKYAFIGIPILFEFPLLNEKGLGFGGNALSLTKNESRYIDEGPGISSYMLLRLTMMTCKNVSEVANLWKNTERASGTYRDWPHHWDNTISVWCDSEGGILAIEQTHNYIITVFGNSTNITGAPEGILWHAGHHQWLDPNLTGSVYPNDYPSSALRAERARELLEANYGNITLDVCKTITRDHGGGTDGNGKDSSDICRHADKNSSCRTVFSWIVLPKHNTVYLTSGYACRGKFWKHDFTNIFEKN